MHDVPEVRDVLVREIVVGEAKGRFHGLELIGRHLPLRLGEHRTGRIARHESGHQEVEGDGDPESHQVKRESCGVRIS